ncbi:hypothetical protein BSU04_43880 [Caballeronia sordidicola]|uniref:Uncharacterized protein n=1 Tax=Caballeronia sordidicola TaxID=196367 RepID=A0A226WMP1_CABSO|nr:hypothetical protein BSU04_43880 [Caballeronia sordidicola]
MNEVSIKREPVSEKADAGYKLFERKCGIPLAAPLKTALATDLRLWSLK